MTDSITLKDFLIKNTTISSIFIDEYYKFYEACTINTFGIDCEKVINYLSITSSKHFYRRLRELYELNIDYIIKKKIVDEDRNSLKNFYHITFDCFEKFCLASKSPKGVEVRNYSNALRKFVYYKAKLQEKNK